MNERVVHKITGLNGQCKVVDIDIGKASKALTTLFNPTSSDRRIACIVLFTVFLEGGGRGGGRCGGRDRREEGKEE